jgi:hypothetical protein
MKTTTVLRVAVAFGLVVGGWSVGRAQSTQPAFELIVDAPVGETTVECLRGCGLAWVEHGVNPAAPAMRTFKFDCFGPGKERCSSFRIGGWIKP